MRVLLFLSVLVCAGCVRNHPQIVQLPVRNPATLPAVDEDREDHDDAHDAVEFFLKRRLPPGETELPLDRYAEAKRRIAEMPVIPIARGTAGLASRDVGAVSSWTSVGPGNIGGRTRSLVINPQNPSIMYAGAVTGGVWKSIDAGQTWTATMDALPVINIGALVMDPSNPDTLYAGTGEYYGGFRGLGIFKTTDGGATWTTLPKTTNSSFYYVNKLLLSPNNSKRIYAAAASGIWTSPDGGTTWSQMLNTLKASRGCQDLAIRQDQPKDYIFASCSGAPGSPDYQIFRNQDAAGTGTWSQVLTMPGMGRTSLVIAPSQPGTMYAMAADNNPSSATYQGLLAFFRSTSNGDASSWEKRTSNTDPNVINTLLLTNSSAMVNAYCNGGKITPSQGQGDWDNALAVDPLNPDIVWAGGIDVFRSNDGGANWGAASLWQVAFGTALFAHADRHAFVFHPGYDGAANQTMYLATDAGLFRTDSALAAVSTGNMGACLGQFLAADQVQWTSLNHNYAAAQFYHGIAYPGGSIYMGGAQDNTVSRGNDLGGMNQWQLFSTGDGTAVGIDPADANIVFESKQHRTLARALDGGTFISAVSGITEPSSGFPFVPFLAVDPHEGRRLFLGGTVSLWRSVDSGASWTAAAPAPDLSGISAIAISPFDSNTVLFGTMGGYIYSSSSALSSDNTKPWASARPRSGTVSGLAFDPTDPNTIYATYSTFKSLSGDAHVYKSSDGGVTWQPSDGSGTASIPDTPVFRLLINPYSSSALYLGSDLGVFVSQDGGNSWGHDPNAFADVVVEELAFDQVSNPNWLFAFTYGRGAWRAPAPGSASPNCTYTVSPTSVTADAVGGAYPLTISAAPGCTWSAIPGLLPASFSVQSPAMGIGNGTAVITAAPNTSGPRNDTLTVANTTITVTQGTSAVQHIAAQSPGLAATLTFPGIGQIDSTPLGTSAGDPTHSCTGSTDFKTAWWKVTPAASGTLQVVSYGRRYDVYGNSGIVLTAYPQSDLTAELGCAVVPRDTAAEIDASIKFNAIAGTTYLIEVSATGNSANDGGQTTVVVRSSTPTVAISLTPSSKSVLAGSNPLQFSAQVLNAPNAAVRWTISPSSV